MIYLTNREHIGDKVILIQWLIGCVWNVSKKVQKLFREQIRQIKTEICEQLIFLANNSFWFVMNESVVAIAQK